MLKNSSFFLRIFCLFSLLISLSGCIAGEDSDSDDSGSTDVTVPDQPGSDGIFNRTINFCNTQDPDNKTQQDLSISFNQFMNTNSARLQRAQLARNTKSISVHFHVVSKGSTLEEGEVPDDVLLEQIDVLNRAYSGEMGGVETPFRFSLSSINRVRSPEWHNISPASAEEQEMKETLKIGGAQDLNVYILDIQTPEDLAGSEGGVLLGYSTLPILYSVLPSFDGIVINFRALPGGILPHYNLGNVLVHESGHWLGLFHTFLGQCDQFFNDLIPDTPRELTPSGKNFCPESRDSCPDAPGVDPIHNHMTYTGDECRFEFTAGQIEFMVFNAAIFRQIVTF